METIFKELFNINGVYGILYISAEGDPLFKKFLPPMVEMNDKSWNQFTGQGQNWSSLVSPFSGVQEAELVFLDKKIFIRKTESGFILVILDISVSIAMIRLNCNIIAPMLVKIKKSKGFGGLFKKK